MKIEDYVTFEVAKLLEDKEFREKCNAVYYPAYKGAVPELHRYNNKVVMYSLLTKEYKGGLVDEYLAPSLYDAQKWLREKHRVFVNIESTYYDGFIFIFNIWTFDNGNIGYDSRRTYEEALNEGIKEALKLI